MVLYSSFVAPYYMKWLRNIQIIRIIRIIFRYSNIRIMIFKLWILFVIRFGHFLPTNIIRLFDSLQNDYSWQHCRGHGEPWRLPTQREVPAEYPPIQAQQVSKHRWVFHCCCMIRALHWNFWGCSIRYIFSIGQITVIFYLRNLPQLFVAVQG